MTLSIPKTIFEPCEGGQRNPGLRVLLSSLPSFLLTSFLALSCVFPRLSRLLGLIRTTAHGFRDVPSGSLRVRSFPTGAYLVKHVSLGLQLLGATHLCQKGTIRKSIDYARDRSVLSLDSTAYLATSSQECRSKT